MEWENFLLHKLGISKKEAEKQYMNYLGEKEKKERIKYKSNLEKIKNIKKYAESLKKEKHQKQILKRRKIKKSETIKRRQKMNYDKKKKMAVLKIKIKIYKLKKIIKNIPVKQKMRLMWAKLQLSELESILKRGRILVKSPNGKWIREDSMIVEKLAQEGYEWDDDGEIIEPEEKGINIYSKIYSTDIWFFIRIGKIEAENNRDLLRDKNGRISYVKDKYGDFYKRIKTGIYNMNNIDILKFEGRKTYIYEDEWDELISLLYENEEIAKYFHGREIEIYCQMIFINKIIEINGMKNLNYKPNEEELQCGQKEETIFHKFIKYGLNKNANSFGELFKIEHTEYISDNYKTNSCYVNLLIDAYRPTFDKDRKNKKYYNIDFNYDYLVKLCEIKKHDDQLPLTINKSLIFFKKFSLNLIVIGAFGCIIYFKADKVNKKLNPRTLFVYVQNGHAYRINDKLNFLKEIKWEKLLIKDKISDEIKNINVSNQFRINDNKKEENKTIFINDICELTNEIKKINNEKNIYFVFEGDLKYLLFHMIRQKYCPYVTFSNDNIKMITMKIENTMIFISDNIVKSKTNIDQYLQEDEYTPYFKANDIFYNGVVCKENMSKYNHETIEIDKKYKLSPLNGYFLMDGKDEDYYKEMKKMPMLCGLDSRKAYTSDFMDIKNYPVFNQFDIFVKYDGSEIMDENQYIVKHEVKNNEELILFRNIYNRCYGYKLNRISKSVKYEILYYRKPSSLQPSNSIELVNNLYDTKISNDEENDIGLKKSIVNITLGKLEKKKNKKRITKIFKNYDEACYYQSKYGGKIYPICGDDDEKNMITIYLLVIIFEKELVSGFTPIKDMIYEIRSLKNYLTCCKLKENGIKYIGIHTDSILFKKKYVSKIKELFDVKKTA